MAKADDKSTPVVVWEVPGPREPQASPERSLAEEWQRRGQELRRTLLTGAAFLRGLSTPLNLPEPPVGEPIPLSPGRRKPGTKEKYDWDAIQARCHQRLEDTAIPENVSKFCRDEILPWCDGQYGEDGTPDIETLRPRVAKWIAAWERAALSK
jgi:hypothetical protein